ncbi:mechanosensitive ion channel domain-containing protein [Zophobihabitans entericus]|uniref:Small-conductance mechanosensitive channel n=1 Tax=Zophobihabitans entericus TaxID=1635327 RepID=A0A6G9I7X6_9GAMM|nr:mechanosensitive ion channel domain-containing protein [Zophobihabitans entericus]QIQ20311.1 mechanosensitive ion channel [Zophobihabitans entericus]
METENIEQQAIAFLDKYDNIIVSYALNILFAIIIFIIGRFVAGFASRFLKRLLLRRQVEPTLISFSVTLSRYAIIAFTLIAVLGQLGVQTASIVAVVGAAGLAIGLALQGSLSNFAAGVLLIIFRPFKSGELIDIGIIGTVQTIQIFSTTLSTPDGKIAVIPNSKVVAGNIINYSRDPNRRIDLIIGVEYNASLELVKDVLLKAIHKTDNIQMDRAVTIRLDELASSSLNFVVQVWVLNDNYGSVRAQLLENIKTELDNHNIGIPYPTMELNFSSVDNGNMQHVSGNPTTVAADPNIN